MDSWLTIMLMCGLVIASLQGTNGSRLRRSRPYKDPVLKTNIHQLQEHYNTLGAEWVGNTVFAPYLDRLNSRGSCTCQSIMLEGMLNVYEEIFTDMFNKLEKKELKASVKDVMTEVKKMRPKYSEEQKLWRDLQDLHLVKVKNSTIQGAALNEFFMVINQAHTEKHHNKRN